MKRSPMYAAIPLMLVAIFDVSACSTREKTNCDDPTFAAQYAQMCEEQDKVQTEEVQQALNLSFERPQGLLPPIQAYVGLSNVTGPWYHWVLFRSKVDGKCHALIVSTSSVLQDRVTIHGTSGDDTLWVQPSQLGAIMYTCPNQGPVTLSAPNVGSDPHYGFTLVGYTGNDYFMCGSTGICQADGNGGHDYIENYALRGQLWGREDNDTIISHVGGSEVYLDGGAGRDCISAPSSVLLERYRCTSNGLEDGDLTSDSSIGFRGMGCDRVVPSC